MMELQGAVGIAQLKKLDEVVKTQRKNMDTLIDHVLNLPSDYEHFNMGGFATHDGVDLEATKVAKVFESCGCGTSACFLGHGPMAGIKARKNEDWYAYAERQFGLTSSHLRFGFTHAAWVLCFSAAWAYCGGTAEQAALRAQYLLDYGVPTGFNCPAKKWTDLVSRTYDVVEVAA